MTEWHEGLAADRPQVRTTSDDVANTYRLVLGREPESSSVVDANVGRATGDILRAFVESDEFQSVLKRTCQDGLPLPHHAIAASPTADLREWAARVLPLTEASAQSVRGVHSWMLLLKIILTDPLLGLADQLSAGNARALIAAFMETVRYQDQGSEPFNGAPSIVDAHGNDAQPAVVAPSASAVMPQVRLATREDVTNFYRFALGRDPENADVVDWCIGKPCAQVFLDFVQSDEFVALFTKAMATPASLPHHQFGTVPSRHLLDSVTATLALKPETRNALIERQSWLTVLRDILLDPIQRQEAASHPVPAFQALVFELELTIDTFNRSDTPAHVSLPQLLIAESDWYFRLFSEIHGCSVPQNDPRSRAMFVTSLVIDNTGHRRPAPSTLIQDICSAKLSTSRLQSLTALQEALSWRSSALQQLINNGLNLTRFLFRFYTFEVSHYRVEDYLSAQEIEWLCENTALGWPRLFDLIIHNRPDVASIVALEPALRDIAMWRWFLQHGIRELNLSYLVQHRSFKAQIWTKVFALAGLPAAPDRVPIQHLPMFIMGSAGPRITIADLRLPPETEASMSQSAPANGFLALCYSAGAESLRVWIAALGLALKAETRAIISLEHDPVSTYTRGHADRRVEGRPAGNPPALLARAHRVNLIASDPQAIATLEACLRHPQLRDAQVHLFADWNTLGLAAISRLTHENGWTVHKAFSADGSFPGLYDHLTLAIDLSPATLRLMRRSMLQVDDLKKELVGSPASQDAALQELSIFFPEASRRETASVHTRLEYE